MTILSARHKPPRRVWQEPNGIGCGLVSDDAGAIGVNQKAPPCELAFRDHVLLHLLNRPSRVQVANKRLIQLEDFELRGCVIHCVGVFPNGLRAERFVCGVHYMTHVTSSAASMSSRGSRRAQMTRSNRAAQPQFPPGLLTLALPPFIGVQVGGPVSEPRATEPLVAVAVTTLPVLSHCASTSVPAPEPWRSPYNSLQHPWLL
jgi:hypothetical protein